MKDMICSRCNSGDNVKMELGDEPGKIRKNSRNPFRLYAVNTVLYKLIFLNLMSGFCLRNIIVRRQDIPEKQIISNVLIILCAKEFHGLSEELFLFQKKLRITSGQYCFLFIIIML